MYVKDDICKQHIVIRSKTKKLLKILAENHQCPDDVIIKLIEFYASVKHNHYILEYLKGEDEK